MGESDVWLHRVESWDGDRFPGLPVGTLVAVDDPVDADLDHPARVSSRDVVVWQDAVRRFEDAQRVMEALFAQGEALTAAMDAVFEEAERADWERERIETEALTAIAEAEAEREHGPRQWVAADRSRWNSDGRGRTLVARILHHVDCGHLARGLARSNYDEDRAGTYEVGKPVRTPEARALLARPVSWSAAPPLRVCRSCAARTLTPDPETVVPH